MKKSLKYYQNLFKDYPDVVLVSDLLDMLGICDSTARNLIRQNHIKHYCISRTFYVPKQWVIEYVMSEHYAVYKNKLKVKI